MHKYKIKLDFAYYPVPILIEFSGNTVTQMDKNPLFPTPDVPLTEVTTATSLLATKFKASRNKGKSEISDMHDAQDALIALLYKQVDYVSKIAAGNHTIILKSGFVPTNDPSPALRPEFKVIVGAEDGQVILIHKAVKEAGAYLWQYVADPMPADDKLWVLAGVSIQTKCVIENLDSGVKFWFRVTPITRKGPLPHSEPIMKLVS